MISEKQARTLYSQCRDEILHRVKNEENDQYIDVVFLDDGDIMMLYADLSKRLHLQQQNQFFFGVDCHISVQLDDIDQSFEDAIKELSGLTAGPEPFNGEDITDLDNWL
jgi:hypothetical protein